MKLSKMVDQVLPGNENVIQPWRLYWKLDRCHRSWRCSSMFIFLRVCLDEETRCSTLTQRTWETDYFTTIAHTCWRTSYRNLNSHSEVVYWQKILIWASKRKSSSLRNFQYSFPHWSRFHDSAASNEVKFNSSGVVSKSAKGSM